MACLIFFISAAADYYLASSTAVAVVCFKSPYRGFYLCYCSSCRCAKPPSLIEGGRQYQFSVQENRLRLTIIITIQNSMVNLPG